MRTLLLLAALATAPLAQAHTIDELDWMKGCWRTEVEGQEITEVWTAPPAPVMLGTAITRRDGAVFWEQMRIEERDGALALIAMPGGAAPVRFEMTEMGDNHIVFENPNHDYPRRIVYTRMDRMLTARVDSGLPHVLGEAFAYRRISCPRAFLP